MIPRACLLFLLCGWLAACGSREPDLARMERSVVRVHSFGEGLNDGHGSGFLINRDGAVVTNYHVIDGGKVYFAARKSGGKVEISPLEVVAADKEHDLAVLKLANHWEIEPVTLYVGKPEVSTPVIAVGFPGMLDDVATKLEFAEKVFGAPALSQTVLYAYMLASKSVEQQNPDLTEEEKNQQAVAIMKNFAQNDSPEAREVKRFFDDKRAFLTGEGPHPAPVIEIDERFSEIVDPAVFFGRIGKIVIRPLKSSFTVKTTIIEHDAKIAGGNSGGPLFDECGRVVGVNAQVWNVGMQTARSISAQEVKAFLQANRIPFSSTEDPCDKSGGFPWGWLILLAVVGGVVWFILGQSGRRRGMPPPPPPMPPAAPALVGVLSDGKSVRCVLDLVKLKVQGALVIGRSSTLADLPIEDASLSRRHAAIVWVDGQMILEDRNAANGTFLNGQPITGRSGVPLQHGDQITLGEVKLRLQMQ